MSTLLDHALQYATERGWYVFPLNGKQPITPNGFKDATLDPEQIRRWWTAYPTAGIGIACGASGLFVIDVDPKHGGVESLQRLQQEHGDLPHTLTSSTGGGGAHLFYSGAGPDTVGRLGEGIDTRSSGGYIVAPPSTHPSGGVYSWLLEVPILPVPDWVLELASAKHRQPLPKADEAIIEGGRNTALMRLAGTLRAMGTSDAELEAAVTTLNRTRCRPPLPDEEVARIVSNAQRYEQGPALVEYVGADVIPDTVEEGVAYDIRTTDLGNALRLERRYGNDLRYVHDWDTWLVWEGNRWRISDSGQAERLAIDTVVAIENEVQELQTQYATVQGEYQALARPTFGNEPPDPRLDGLRRRMDMLDRQIKALAKHAHDSQSSGKIAATLSVAKARERLAKVSTQLDSEPFLLGCPNGVIDLRTGERRNGARADLITRQVGTVYDPQASCPRWELFLGQIMCGDSTLVRYLQQAVGYTLTGSVKEQLFFFLYGDGSNGKSVFTSILMSLLGDYGRMGAKTLLEEDRTGSRHTTDLASLQGARAVVLTETEEAQGLPEASIKRLTGGEPITARKLYKDDITFLPTHKLWVSGNYKPEIRGADYGMWRRLRCIPFKHTVREADRDPDLLDKLRGELPGILAWAVSGCLEWQQRGLVTPQVVSETLAEYRAEQDVIGQFLGERTEQQPEGKVSAQELYQAYSLWSSLNGYRHPLNMRRFKSDMQRRGYAQVRVSSGVSWLGLGLRT